MSKVIRDKGLTLALFLLFLLSILGQSFAGLAQHNEDLRDHGQRELTYFGYVTSAGFGESVFENWESEFLQMALYVILTGFLFQRGSAESKDPDKKEDVDEDPRAHMDDPGAPYPVRRGGFLLKLYRHSLAIALSMLFLASFVSHLLASTKENCREQLSHGQACQTVFAYMGNGKFWFESFQNWQSEFLSIGVLVVLSIFFRQQGSPESKPVHASHSKTGR